MCVCMCLGVQRVSFVQDSILKREMWLMKVCVTGCDSGQFTLLHVGTADGLDWHVVMLIVLQ